MLWALMVAYVTGMVNQELLLRNEGGVGVERGTASRVWQSHIYKDVCGLAQAKGLPSLIYHEAVLEVRFMRGAAGTKRILTIRGGKPMSASVDALKHVVCLMMENRSFDHMLGFLKSANYPIEGLSGTESNLDANGAPVAVTDDAIYFGDLTPDPGHSHVDIMQQLFDGASPATANPSNTGFVKNYSAITNNAGNSHRSDQPHHSIRRSPRQ